MPHFDDGGASLASIFEGHAARYPDRLAVVSGDRRLTYGEAEPGRQSHCPFDPPASGAPTPRWRSCSSRERSIVAAILGVL